MLVFNVPVLQGVCVCVCPTAWKWDMESTLFHTKLTWTTQSDLGEGGVQMEDLNNVIIQPEAIRSTAVKHIP